MTFLGLETSISRSEVHGAKTSAATVGTKLGLVVKEVHNSNTIIDQIS